jgi:NhaA family Na+:H+ antiporter
VIPKAVRHSSDADLWGGLALGAAALAALIIANSPLQSQYRALFDATAEVRIGQFGLSKSLEHWINDGLMAIFLSDRPRNQTRNS